MADTIAAVPFALLALAALGGALAVVASRTGARAVYWSIETTLAVAGLCLILSADYAAAAHLVVLGGAIPACAALATMTAPPSRPRRLRPARAVAFASACALALAAAVAGLAPVATRVAAPSRPLALPELGTALYSSWALSVEIVAVILLVVLVAAGRMTEEGGRG